MNARGMSALPCTRSTRRSTGMSTTSSTKPQAASGRAGEMPAKVKGQPVVGATTPQAGMRDTPNRNRPKPSAASAVPTPSSRALRPSACSAGSRTVLSSTSTK